MGGGAAPQLAPGLEPTPGPYSSFRVIWILPSSSPMSSRKATWLL